jgi:hypothetical protein
MKAVGGVFAGLVMAALLIILPGRDADALSARRPAFRHWYQPRRLRFGVGLTLVSLCFGAAAGFGSANFKPGPNKKDWLTPKDSPLVDKELARSFRPSSPARRRSWASRRAVDGYD